MSNKMSVPMVLSPIFLPDKKMKAHKCHSTLPKTKPHRDLNLLESFAFKNCLQKLHKDLKQPEKKKSKSRNKNTSDGTRTRNLRLSSAHPARPCRRPTPYPLGHGGEHV